MGEIGSTSGPRRAACGHPESDSRMSVLGRSYQFRMTDELIFFGVYSGPLLGPLPNRSATLTHDIPIGIRDSRLPFSGTSLSGTVLSFRVQWIGPVRVHFVPSACGFDRVAFN